MAATHLPALGAGVMSRGAVTGNSNVARARKRICRLAKDLGYIVTREEDEGAVILCLVWLGTNPCVRLIQIVPDGTTDPWPMRERIVTSGAPVIPERVTPSEVQRVLDLLIDIERSIA
jgi:hypothetical protein